MVIKRDTSVSLPIKWKVILYLSGANNFPTLTSGNFVMYLQTNSFPSKLSWAILASKDTVDSEKQSNTVDKKNLKKSHSMDRNKMELFWAIFNHCGRTIIGRLLKKGLVGLNSLMLLKKLLTILTFLNCAIYRFNAGRKKKIRKTFKLCGNH